MNLVITFKRQAVEPPLGPDLLIRQFHMHSEMVSNAEPMRPLHPEKSVKPCYVVNQIKQIILQWCRGPKEVVKNGPKEERGPSS